VQSAASTVTASDSRESLCGTVCGRGAAIKFYVLGDTHGREEAIAVAVRHAKMEGCQQIVQVGDFGNWPHVPDGGEFLAYAEKVCAENDVMFWWLDGNHENHDRLEVLVDEHGRDKPIELSPHVHYLPRSCRWKWEGVTFMALGGAYSIDQQWRTPHISWWSGETITASDVERAAVGDRPDVMLTHDAPLGVTPWAEAATRDRKKDLWPESKANREALTAVFEAVKPSLLVHGHYHRRYIGHIGETRIEGLAADGDPGSAIVLNTDELRRADVSS
jgi:Icc-related predicted phosphoesterase